MFTTVYLMMVGLSTTFFLMACRAENSLQLPNDESAGDVDDVDDVEGSIGVLAADEHGNEDSKIEDASQ